MRGLYFAGESRLIPHRSVPNPTTPMSFFSSACLRNKMFHSACATSIAAVVLGLLSGCETAPSTSPAPVAATSTGGSTETAVQTLKEGDTVRISFPGVPSMDTVQQVRQDGRISLPMLGEHVVSGKTSEELTTELLTLYAPKLVSKEVMVTLVSSSFPIYVSGAVLRPGKVLADRPISAFEAIMEAGGFDKNRANLTAVVVIRQENGQTRNYTVNLQAVLEGKSPTPFMLQRTDTIYVPEKFTWFWSTCRPWGESGDVIIAPSIGNRASPWYLLGRIRLGLK